MSFRRNRICCLVMAVLVSCSIKEEKDLCPCRLYLAFGELVPGNGSVAWRLGSRSSSFVDCGCESFEMWPEGLLFSVPKGEMCIDMLIAGSSVEMNENGLVIPEGRDCPYVYSFSAEVNCTSSEAMDTIVLHKKFALLFCYVHGSDELKGEIQYVVSGNVSGYSVGGIPVEGEFFYPLNLERVSSLQEVGCVSLPVQIDGSLRLDVLSPEGTALRSFALGEYILKSGYDWTEEDLKDINIEVDLVNTSLWIYASGGKIQFFDIDLSHS